MPKVNLWIKNDKEEIKVEASGVFFLGLNFGSNPVSRIRKIVKEYGFKDEVQK